MLVFIHCDNGNPEIGTPFHKKGVPTYHLQNSILLIMKMLKTGPQFSGDPHEVLIGRSGTCHILIQAILQAFTPSPAVASLQHSELRNLIPVALKPNLLNSLSSKNLSKPETQPQKKEKGAS